MPNNPQIPVVEHHLRLMGWKPERTSTGGAALHLLDGPDQAAVRGGCQAARDGACVVALSPRDCFCRDLGIRADNHADAPAILYNRVAEGRAWWRLRTLHPFQTFSMADRNGGEEGEAVVATVDGRPAWLWLPLGRGGVLLVGTRLGEDLIRYRQGDLVQAEDRRNSERWGFAGERPVYLYEAQLAGEDRFDRPADWWAMTLAERVSLHTGVPLEAILPGGAPGAIVITGDDDQAHLEKYAEQRAILGDAPITYFLHPQTRHTRDTLQDLLADGTVDLGLHPDALDQPERYDALFDQQAAWFQELTGQPPRSVRNHGYLNDGYWGHLKPWLRHGVALSSNIPGVDGRVLNGSLLPARMVMDGTLTDHWSVLTAIGDGVIFALGKSPQEAADCLYETADRMGTSGVPGVIVVNLHPQNVAETRALHQAILALGRVGFLLWTMRDCLEWFRDRRTSVGHDKAPLPAYRTAPLGERRERCWAEPLRDDWHSFDRHPWRHPWLTGANLRAARDFSESTLDLIMAARRNLPEKDRRYAFVGNLANNLYLRAVPLRRAGLSVDIYPHPQDDFIMSSPEWEEFDGELVDVAPFRSAVQAAKVDMPSVPGVHRVDAPFHRWNVSELGELPSFVRPSDFLKFGSYLTFLPLCRELQRYDALTTTQAPYLARLANKPYIFAQMGGEVWYEAARDDLLGRLQRLAITDARAFLVSNPLSYAHARRYGLTNLLYVPLMIDEDIYSPGHDPIRHEWEQISGGDFFVLCTARLDDLYKGSGISIDGFSRFAERHPGARLVLLGWGADHEKHMNRLREKGLVDRIIGLPLSGKRRLIRYLRAADCLVDQFILGYYGATALESMACGLPVIMRLEQEQYDALCATGAPPVLQADNAVQVSAHLTALAADPERRRRIGAAHRAWFVANHGSRRWGPVYEALLAAVAAGVQPDYSPSPLHLPLSEEERAYHSAERESAPPFPNYFTTGVPL